MKRSINAVMACLLLGLVRCDTDMPVGIPEPTPDAPRRAMGVCPPFHLRDESGAIINPVAGINDATPYSPRQTCGFSGCHDYQKITKGYHFTQGKGEELPATLSERYPWVRYPGNYGGNWCSPAPLYPQLAARENTHAREIDMTSFDFVVASCGGCHPGGGPLEFDREGRRYDTWMQDPASGMVPGGDNNLDGDYYKARWSESGVIEADCLLCHQPSYDFKKRDAARTAFNFRWTATAGSGLGRVEGAVRSGEVPSVTYDKSRFNPDGTVKLHIVSEPRNETCMTCHSKPGWKKRGAEFLPRTDVHMVANMRCVDCHTSGSKASDPRIRGWEEHQVGKGDCPSGWVRNDLDDTVRSCSDCHEKGWRNAPIANHDWLPPLHMESISCQACHIPSRAVKSALIQASDVHNDAPRINTAWKRIWTFYDQQRRFWNHYGEGDLFTWTDKPTDVSRPTLVRYKGKIYPANRIHGAFVGYEEEGRPGIAQILAKDYYQMWSRHRADPANVYPELALIRDDDGDGTLEINRPEEVDAVLVATARYLADTEFPLGNRRLVWVGDGRACTSGSQCRDLPMESHEATPYASVYKFSHDVAPARAALGAGGCVDCHSPKAPFFQGAVLERAWDETGQPVWTTNAAVLGIPSSTVSLGAFREAILKPIVYALLALVLMLLAVWGVGITLSRTTRWSARSIRLASVAALLGMILSAIYIVTVPGLAAFMTVPRFTLDVHHFPVGVAVVILALFVVASDPNGRTRTGRFLAIATGLAAVAAAGSGGMMLLRFQALAFVVRPSYTIFDISLAVLALLTVFGLAGRLFLGRDEPSVS